MLGVERHIDQEKRMNDLYVNQLSFDDLVRYWFREMLIIHAMMNAPLRMTLTPPYACGQCMWSVAFFCGIAPRP
jgi:hypothetical protein